jgi:hypothetical protein
MTMRRGSLVLCVLGGALVFALAAHAQSRQGVPKGPGSLAGLWSNAEFNNSGTYVPRNGVIRTTTGELPPLQPWAAELLEKRIKEGEAGRPFATTKSMCLPAGIPQMMFGPRLPVQILETPGQVSILFEDFMNFRIIRLDTAHKEDPDPSFMGDSVGHWEGDTLVVDTIGLSERTTLDPIGMPHSDQLHVVERIRRVDENSIEVVVTFEDPETFRRPWTSRTSFQARQEVRIEEFLCENQRNESRDGVTTLQHPAP